MLHVFSRVAMCCLLLSFASNVWADETHAFTVGGPKLAARLSADGRIVGMEGTLAGPFRDTRGETVVVGCKSVGQVKAKRLPDGRVEFARTVVNEKNAKQSCVLVERFSPGETSVRWEIEIRGRGEPWSAPIERRVSHAAAPDTRFWTAWSDPDQQMGRWADPLQVRPLSRRQWTYANRRDLRPIEGNIMSLPLATLLEPGQDAGLSVLLSPEDVLLDVALATTPEGQVTFRHEKHRFSPERPVRLTMDLATHQADWRAAVGWFVGRYPEYFNPPLAKADQMAGCGAYSGDEQEIDVEHFRRMAFRVNWKCSEDFPYMGMFLPPMPNDDAAWERSKIEAPIPGKGTTNSYRILNDYCRRMKSQGFFTLSYFNVTEFGLDMRWPAPPRKATNDADLWKDANDFFHAKLPSGILLNNGRPMWTYGKAIIVDVGDPVYRDFMLEQAQRHLDKQPDADGICIDRMDWLRYYNTRADDGVSWVDGRPARSLYRSWLALMERLGPMMHDQGKAIFANNMVPRIELMRDVDGFYDEHGDFGASLNCTSFLAVRKSAMVWTRQLSDLLPDPDGFFQRHLHLGIYPTAPYPSNNHCITPDAWAEEYYTAYGPMMDAMRGKKWVLAAHAVEASGLAKVNLFETRDGYALPVTFAGDAASVPITLRLPGKPSIALAEAIHPGRDRPVAVPVVANPDGSLRLDVPIHHGCAMVRLKRE